MKHSFFEIQGFTWKAKAQYQQDAILIDNCVIQHNGLVTKHHIFDFNHEWCVAIADGVSHSPRAAQAAKKILELVSITAKNTPSFEFQKLQNQFSNAFNYDLNATGSSTTLALIKHTQSNFLTIQHLGNTRAYLYSLAQELPKWICLTRDHTYLEKLRLLGKLEAGEQYASIYNVLTEYFCADPMHTVNNQHYLEEYLTENEAIVLCSDGVHDVLKCNEWPSLDAELSLKNWLNLIKIELEKRQAYDNASIITIRLRSGNSNLISTL